MYFFVFYDIDKYKDLNFNYIGNIFYFVCNLISNSNE